jgi:hypothetical protein
LTLTLPSGRPIVYPGAHLTPNTKFEGGDPDVEYHDNARGQWKPVRAWFGTLVENVVQGTARDLLAAALLRFAERQLPTIFHCHDEVVIEVPIGSITGEDVLALMLEPPPWAVGLPLGGTVHAGANYFEEPDAKDVAKPLTTAIEDATAPVIAAVEDFIASVPPLEASTEIEREAAKDFLDSLPDTTAPLWDLVTLPMDASHHVACPFHDDPNPSCVIYADHWHCYGCGEHGDRVDWLRRVEGMSRAEAIAALQDWTGTGMGVRAENGDEAKLTYALGLWEAAGALVGTVGERYLAETRGIDTSKLPATIGEALRFHPRCPFGTGGQRAPCIVALMRDPVTDALVGIHRIGLREDNGAIVKIDRMALGHMGVVKLWPANSEGRLVAGEGIETTLATACNVEHDGAALTPAWSTVSKDGLGGLPVIDGVAHLVQLVDHDENGTG